ncbi:uncharacterized protein N7477_001034 [Penicillium maclennaniae]|uniref:uncharacterized protein n=1 Tax=Penicillium maclennaniae TaxID=1343394 RepID=UPI00253FD8EC|nr:uncharacterized protein N7477_001034 [Penicillium maclennaniae]KAJ5684689.1 hypothetical protein N7477_001034 [Penicillium maclennaniae]
MKAFRHILLGLGMSGLGLASAVQRGDEVIRIHSPGDVTADSLHNIHVEFLDSSFEGPLQLVYGECEMQNSWQMHHEIGTTLLGRSSPISVSSPMLKRQSIADVADTMGPWFDGIAYMKSKKESEAFVSKAKNTSVAIVGGGMSGLMTSHLLSSVGIHDWHIYESSERTSISTRKWAPCDSPVSITYADTNETLEIMDHRMVFQLAGVLNEMNADKPDLQVNFIPWIQNGPNLPADSGGVRLPDGPPSSNASAVTAAEAAYANYTKLDDKATIREIATNMYQAHKKAVEDGMFHWSEAGYMRYALGYNANITDYAAGTTDFPIWGDFYDDVYFAATKWRTIDKGLESLPQAFYPHVEDKLTLNRTVAGLAYNESTGKVAVTWRDDPLQMVPEKSREYDYAVVAAPFSKVRLWEMPRYSSLLSRAISSLNYDPACKMALLYETRFWEHMEEPIFGGCGSVDIPGIGSVCYPSYNMNGTGPGVILASYISGTEARSAVALNAEEHVALVQRAMVEVHGEIAAEQFTGIYDRQCWETDRHQNGAWCDPLVGQQELYLPAYYQTEFKTIFIGEHTSYTHAWIFSALDSAVRGSTQLLLDLGLVDEAKSIVETWMGRWIKL